ncbi:MAG: class I adenylate-forming enzyme family protein [Acidimicrobiia bacterium]
MPDAPDLPDLHREPSGSWNALALRRWLGNEAPAIVDDDGVVSGDELMRLASGAAAMFDEYGFEPGDAVPALMDETRTAIAMVVGGALSRRPLAPLGTKLPVEDLVAAVRGLGARHVFVGPDRVELAEQVATRAGVELVCVDSPLERHEPLAGACEPDDTAVIVHTSGTTGRPKPVFLRQRPLVARVDVYQEVMGIGPGDRYCSASPFYHTAGVAMDVTVLGMGVAIIPQDWFSIDHWRRAGRLGVTCALLVPTMIEMLLAGDALSDASPRVLQYGAMPIHPDTLRAAMRALPDTRFLQIFGQTEVSPISFLDHDDHVLAAAHRPELLLSVGRAIRGAELRVEHPDDDGIGEIAIRAPHVFQADEDGWRRTGDLGVISEEGFVTLHGRTGDRIIRGGENIYPVEVENALREHPGVRDVAVVGVADRRWGEVVKAVIVPTVADAPPNPDELRPFVAARIAHFKVPAIIEFTTELPRTASGKVLRRRLK